MGKKIAIISVIVLFSALLILGFFLQQGRKDLFTDPYKVISPGACIVIETVDLKSFLNSLTTGRGLFGELGKISEISRFNHELKYLADQLNNQNFKMLFNNGSALISFQSNASGIIVPLLSMPVSGDIRMRHIRDMLKGAGIRNMTETKNGGSAILELPFDASFKNDTIYVSLISGLIVCSTEEGLVRNAASSIKNENDIRNSPGFQRVQFASGKNVDKVFIVFPNLTALLKPVLKNSNKKIAEKITSLASIAEGDIYINEDGLVLSGYTECTDSSEIMYRHKTIISRDFHAFKILPSATVLFESMVVPSFSDRDVSDTSVAPEAYQLAHALKPWSGEEITKAIIDVKGSPVQDNTVLIYELSNRVQAEQAFIDQPGIANEVLYFKPDEQIKIPVYKTSLKGLIRVMVPGFAPGINEVYFTFTDRFMISGSSFSTISRLLYDNILNKTLANDLIYRDFENTLPSRAGYYFYCIPSKITDFLDDYFNANIISSLETNRSSLSKIQAAGYKFSASNGMIYNSLSVKYKEKAREESSAEWETLLDTTAAIKPFFFTNHITGAREIFIQDLKNNTYLINAAGRILWKVPLKERITGNVYMIDYYKNGKYQILFSGRNYLHLLDRNGNYVERYPVKLRSPSTNPMVMFDYDNNLNYRIFITGEDKLIYSYDKTGNVVKGWQPFRTAGIVKNEINYFKVSGKDYILASDDNSIYFLDRTGNKRLNLQESVVKAQGSELRLNLSSDPFVICSSPDGTIEQIYFDGSVKRYNIRSFSAKHAFDFFDVDGDGFGEYIFIDKGILYIYDHKRDEIFKREVSSEELGGPINFIFSATDRKIGVIDTKKSLIYLIGKNGKTMSGFPLKGASMFSIGKLSEKSGWHLIVGGTDRFLYNYKIDTDIQ